LILIQRTRLQEGRGSSRKLGSMELVMPSLIVTCTYHTNGVGAMMFPLLCSGCTTWRQQWLCAVAVDCRLPGDLRYQQNS
jgi:hypothetical protein